MKKIFTILMMALAFTGVMAQSSKKHVNDDFYFRFHWGFNNWGTSQLNGLSGISDAAYNLKTSFSSYQLSMGYNIMNSRTIEAGVGIGYESDVYKYNTPEVNYVAALKTFVQGPLVSDASTKLCARYVTLPLSVAWKHNNGQFKIRLSAIPGLNYSGSHTGLKVEKNGTMDRNPLNDVMNPYKFDVRVDFVFSGIGVFFQVATLPVMNDGFNKDLYPIKFGFVL